MGDQMYEPIFNRTDNLDYYVEDLERTRFRIERMLIMPKHEQWLRREAFTRTAYSSTMVENAAIPEQEMEKAIKLSPVAGIPKDRVEVSNYGRGLEFVDFVSDDAEITCDESVIRQVHWFLMKGMKDSSLHPGQYRTEPNWIEDQGVKVYEPAFHVDVPMLMREFSVWLREDKVTHAILKAGIAHARLVAIHPFVDGNGRTGRLLATCLLQKSGYGFRKLLSLDAYYQRNRDRYIGALRQSLGEKFHPDQDLTAWLEFFALSLSVQASMLEARLTDWRMMLEGFHKSMASSGLNERQMDGLLYATRIGQISRKYYCEITGVSPLTGTRDLSEMTNRGFLIPDGQGRNRVYKYKGQDQLKSTGEEQPKLL
jgi:Fic family protein